ncbi:MAG TPA: hypothetical protein VFE63_22205 [Roseiarcus sp.]|nr:hypothetical protein [Roseiarcus sp.]
MSSLDFFLPLAKVDLDQRLVTGVATAEAPDRSGEICDYSSSKPYFEKWSAKALQASGGKSRGALRAMHGKIAAGKLTDISFDDETKRIVVSAKIVDDDEWRKVTEGVYTGFSQGGRYVKRWPDPESGLVRYTAEPHEISLVDLPCLPEATFEVVKDGVVEKRGFASRAEHREPSPTAAPAQAPDAPAKEAPSAERRAATTPEALPPLAPEALAEAIALADAVTKLERSEDENARLRKSLDDAQQTLTDLAKRVAALEAQPMPAKAALRALSKNADGQAEALGVDEAILRLAALPPEARALALTKLSLANPLRY